MVAQRYGVAGRFVAILSGVAVVMLLVVSSASAGSEQSPAPVSESLAEQLATATAADTFRLMVHGTDLAAADAAVAATGMTKLGEFRQVGIVVACGTPAQIEAARTEPGVTYLEGEQTMQFHSEPAAQPRSSGCAEAGC